MKKRGFTLIEIIICISLITIIGVGSFIGIKLVNDKIKTTKLEQITDKAIEAAQVYIETNKQSYNELYSNQNGVSIPIKLLVDEGLLDISNTTLEDKDLKDEYVVTFLGGSGGSENCEQITSSASWANDKPLYLCMRSDGSSNLAIIDPADSSNISKISKEYYVFAGADATNYIKYNNNTFRILVINPDDSLVLYRTTDFADIFASSEILPVDIYANTTNQNITFAPANRVSGFLSNFYAGTSSTVDTNGVKISSVDFDHATFRSSWEDSCWSASNCRYKFSISSFIQYNFGDLYSSYGSNSIYGTFSGYKIRLKACMKIISGTGSNGTPYILENQCS